MSNKRTATDQWGRINKDREEHEQQLMKMLTERIHATEQRVNASTQPTATAATTNAATAADAPRWYKQLVHRVDGIQPTELRSMSSHPPTPAEMPALHRLWHWQQGVAFEDPSIPYTFEMAAVTHQDLVAILGATVVQKIFGTDQVVPTDTVSSQGRQLLHWQMAALHAILTGTGADADTYVEAQTEARAALDEHLPTLREKSRQLSYAPY